MLTEQFENGITQGRFRQKMRRYSLMLIREVIAWTKQ